MFTIGNSCKAKRKRLLTKNQNNKSEKKKIEKQYRMLLLKNFGALVMIIKLDVFMINKD